MALTKLTSNLIEGGTGTDWVTAIQTSNFTAEAGKGYFVNTTSQVLYVNLPVGVVGMEITIQDYAGTFGTNKVILNANGSEKIQGSTIEGQITTNNATAVLIYQDATKGWTSQDVTPPLTLSYLVVAGGGGGGGNTGAGGGGGGYLTNYSGSAISLTGATNYIVTVGAGGPGVSNSTSNGASGGQGVSSVFSIYSAAGGGGGGSYSNAANVAGGNGASGGGGGCAESSGGTNAGGSATPSGQGFAGGSGHPSNGDASYASGGGGGAGTVGANASSNNGGNGGVGISNSITGSAVYHSGGGGGAVFTGTNIGLGGNGGGGNGGIASSANGVAGATNTGGGGGGGAYGFNPGLVPGGSGIVILRYPDAYTITNPGSGLTFTTATDGSDKVTTFTAGTGNIQFN